MSSRYLSLGVAILIGGAAALIFLEVLAQLLPVQGGALAADPDPRWPVYHSVPHSRYTYSAGWDLEEVQHGSINNFGYIAPFDYQVGAPGVVVIGDSFIESKMNDYRETLQGQLPEYLGQAVTVMNFGTSAASMPHYLGVASLVGEYFKPQWAVVLVTGVNYSDGFRQSPGFYHWAMIDSQPAIELVPDRRKRFVEDVVRRSAVVAYVRANLRASFRYLIYFKNWRAPKECGANSLSEMDRSRLRYFVNGLPQRLRLPPSHVILVLDTDRQTIYQQEPIASSAKCPSLDDRARAFLLQEAPQSGVAVIDMDPVFRQFYAATGQRLDYYPTDGHWNGTAHGLAAQQVAALIRSREADGQ
jgi:hypothetical protein